MSIPPAELFDDEAVYRRTVAGQREWVGGAHLSRPEREFLSMVTGFTPLRVLLDMGIDQTGASDAILALVRRRLIELKRS